MDLSDYILTDTYDPRRRKLSEECYRSVIKTLARSIFCVGEHRFIKAPPELDKYELADIIYHHPDGDRHIAVRMRDSEDYQRFKGDVTLRAKNRDYQTEVSKILEGKGHYMFYGWTPPATGQVFGWSFIDLNGLRGNWNAITKNYIPNGDGGKTGMMVMRLNDLYRFSDPAIILACSMEIRRDLNQARKPVVREDFWEEDFPFANIG